MNPRRLPHLTLAVAGSAALFVVAQAAMVWQLGPIADDLFKLQVTWSFTDWTATIAGWDHDGVRRFVTHFFFDTFHPFIYCTALALGLARGMNVARVPPRFDRLIYVPYLAALADLAENALYLLNFRQWAQTGQWSTGWFFLGNSFALLKWTIALLSLVAVIALSVKRPAARTEGSP